MASILLTDPLLQWLEPAERHRVRSLNREHRDAIDAHTATQTSYTVRMHPALPWRSRQALYKRYPKVQTLIFECGGPDKLEEYLHPNLKSISLVVPISVVYGERHRFSPDASFREAIVPPLKALSDFMKNPGRVLQSLEISFAPTVNIWYTRKNAIRVGYDRDGPLYEDKDELHAYKIPHELVFKSFTLYCERHHEDGFQIYKDIAFALWDITKKLPNRWKSLKLPACYPGADDLSGATLTGKHPDDCSDEEVDLFRYFLWCEIAGKN